MRYLIASVLLILALAALKWAFNAIGAGYGRDAALLFAAFGTIFFIGLAALTDYQQRKDQEDREIYVDREPRPIDGEILGPPTKLQERK